MDNELAKKLANDSKRWALSGRLNTFLGQGDYSSGFEIARRFINSDNDMGIELYIIWLYSVRYGAGTGREWWQDDDNVIPVWDIMTSEGGVSTPIFKRMYLDYVIYLRRNYPFHYRSAMNRFRLFTKKEIQRGEREWEQRGRGWTQMSIDPVL